MRKVFLDDKREPPDDSWIVVRTANACIEELRAGPIDELALDHDLGHCDKCTECEGYKSPCPCRCHLTGYFVVLWMETEGVWPRNKPTVHSANPAGAAKMRAAIDREWEKRG